MDIDPSAHKHGVEDDDIHHAMSYAMAIDDQDDDTRLYLGPSRNAALLVATLLREDGSEVAIHAMYRRLLPGE